MIRETAHGGARNTVRQDALFDPDEVVAGLHTRHAPGEVFEIRILEGRLPGDRMGGEFVGFFDNAEDVPAALAQFASWVGAYDTINPVDPKLLARRKNRIDKAKKNNATSNGDVERRTHLLLDIDPQRPAGISSTDDEKLAAKNKLNAVVADLSARGWPEPVVIDSGNGYHAVYRIDLPADDGGLVERVLKSLAAKYDYDESKVDTSVHNAARIGRTPGTLACKGDSTDDRPHRRSGVVSQPEEIAIVPEALLRAIADELPKLAAASTSKPTNGYHAEPFDLPAFIQRHGLDVDGPHDWRTQDGQGQKWSFKTSPCCEHHGGDAMLGRLQNGAIVAKCLHNSCSWGWADLRAKFEPKPEYRPQTGARAPQANTDWVAATFGEPKVDAPKEESKKPFFNRITAAELAAMEFQMEYIVEHIRAAAQPGCILGPQKSLKTSVMLDEGISIALGGKFLNWFDVPKPRRVLVMSGESGLPTLKETAGRICRAKGTELSAVDRLIFSDSIPRIADAFHLAEMKKFLVGDGIECLYIDPLYLALDSEGREGSVFAMGAMLRGISEVCQSCGVTLTLLHHLRKTGAQRGPGQQNGPADLSDASWSGTAEFARQWGVLSRRKPYQSGSGVHELWFNVGGSAGHNGLYVITINEGVGYGNRHWDVAVVAVKGPQIETTN